MKRIATYVVWLALFAAAAILAVKLFPPGGHLGSDSNFVERLTILALTAFIATIVIWIFKRVRGEVSFKASVPGGGTVEFSAAQTQIIMWCIVFAVSQLADMRAEFVRKLARHRDELTPAPKPGVLLPQVAFHEAATAPDH